MDGFGRSILPWSGSSKIIPHVGHCKSSHPPPLRVMVLPRRMNLILGCTSDNLDIDIRFHHNRMNHKFRHPCIARSSCVSSLRLQHHANRQTVIVLAVESGPVIGEGTPSRVGVPAVDAGKSVVLALHGKTRRPQSHVDFFPDLFPHAWITRPVSAPQSAVKGSG